MDDKDYLEVSRKYYLTEETPLLMPGNMLQDFFKLVEISITTIQNYDNPRAIIIESWLILDFMVRDLIISGLELHKFCYEDFDLHYKLLPVSFKDCIDILEKFLNKQRKLEKYQDYSLLTVNVKFWMYFHKNYSDVYDKLKSIQEEYLEKEFPEYLQKINSQLKYTEIIDKSNINKEYRKVSELWLNITKCIDEDWFKNIRKINEIRNYAAHMFNSDLIFEKIGVNGDNKIDLLKKYCLQIIEKIAKI